VVHSEGRSIHMPY